MITIRSCVIDDEPLAGRLIGSYIEKTPSMELCGVFTSAQDAIKTLIDGKIDIVYLDIQMPQLTGLELARIIPSRTNIIFTTAYSKHAIEGYRARAVDYLLKPVSYVDFLEATKKAAELTEMRRHSEARDLAHESIIVKSDYKLVQISLDKILYIEGLKDYVKIYIENEQRPIMTLISMKHLEQSLPPAMFMRIHRSFIINLSKISRIERMHVVIGSGTLPISESYRPQIADYINAHAIMPVKAFQSDD